MEEPTITTVTWKDRLKNTLVAIKDFLAIIFARVLLYGLDKGFKDFLNLFPEQHKPKKSAARLLSVIAGGIVGGLTPRWWSFEQNFTNEVVQPYVFTMPQWFVLRVIDPMVSAMAFMSLFAYVTKFIIQKVYSLFVNKDKRRFSNSGLCALTDKQIKHIFEENPRLETLMSANEIQLMNDYLLTLIYQVKNISDTPIIIPVSRLKLARELLLQGKIEEYNRVKKIVQCCIQIKAQEVGKVNHHIRYIQAYNDAMTDVEEEHQGEKDAVLNAKIEKIKELKETSRAQYQQYIKSFNESVHVNKIGDDDTYQSFMLEQNFYNDQIKKIEALLSMQEPNVVEFQTKKGLKAKDNLKNKIVLGTRDWSEVILDGIKQFRRKKTLRKDTSSVLHDIERLPDHEFSQILGTEQKLHIGDTIHGLISTNKKQITQQFNSVRTSKIVYKGDSEGEYSPMSIWAAEYQNKREGARHPANEAGQIVDVGRIGHPSKLHVNHADSHSTDASYDQNEDAKLYSSHPSFNRLHDLESGLLPGEPALQLMSGGPLDLGGVSGSGGGFNGGSGFYTLFPHRASVPSRRQRKFVNHVL